MYETIDCPSFEAHLLYGFFRRRIGDEGATKQVLKMRNRRSAFFSVVETDPWNTRATPVCFTKECNTLLEQYGETQDYS